MKKAIAIFFCVQLLSGNTFATEVMKLPFLVQHYFEHEKAEHPDLGFGDYLWEHYVKDNHGDEEKGHCDEKLPFKHCNDCCSHHTSIIVYTLPENSSPIVITHAEVNQHFMMNEQFISFYHCCIWQPPQIS